MASRLPARVLGVQSPIRPVRGAAKRQHSTFLVLPKLTNMAPKLSPVFRVSALVSWLALAIVASGIAKLCIGLTAGRATMGREVIGLPLGAEDLMAEEVLSLEDGMSFVVGWLSNYVKFMLLVMTVIVRSFYSRCN